MNLYDENKDRKRILLVVGVAIAIVILATFFWPRGQKESLVIVDGAQYQLASYAATKAQLGDQEIDGYLLTITYEDPSRGTTRATINVPKSGLVVDRTLPVRTVIWDSPTTLEGKTYSGARWNPGYKVPARDRPSLVPEKPLTRASG